MCGLQVVEDVCSEIRDTFELVRKRLHERPPFVQVFGRYVRSRRSATIGGFRVRRPEPIRGSPFGHRAAQPGPRSNGSSHRPTSNR